MQLNQRIGQSAKHFSRDTAIIDPRRFPSVAGVDTTHNEHVVDWQTGFFQESDRWMTCWQIKFSDHFALGRSFADEFRVGMAHPRDRTTLNDHPEYKRLKREITAYLMNLNREARELSGAPALTMPDIAPKDFSLPVASPRLKRDSAA